MHIVRMHGMPRRYAILPGSPTQQPGIISMNKFMTYSAFALGLSVDLCVNFFYSLVAGPPATDNRARQLAPVDDPSPPSTSTLSHPDRPSRSLRVQRARKTRTTPRPNPGPHRDRSTRSWEVRPSIPISVVGRSASNRWFRRPSTDIHHYRDRRISERAIVLPAPALGRRRRGK